MPAYIVFNDRTLIEMAERHPQTLDDMAAISGVGARKLERYGAAFLSVITGAEPPRNHPARRRLAGRDAWALYDRLQDANRRLERGESGQEKPLSCSASLLARVAELPGDDRSRLDRLLGERRARRFGDAFWQILTDPR